ncbi:MAG: 16S rRNA (uracil(1498)-N(3))-methyltransferase [Planctomycetes bacterium]|nr:16S rRNA (uracil(1498)-N(3))-methyltransferase [Planctomycetota bacterium]
MSLERFHVGRSLAGARSVLVAETEARHMTKVMRKRPGDEVTVFDGEGREARARILAVARDQVELEILEILELDRAPACRIALEVALPRGGEAQDLVRRAVECGVAELRPIHCERSVHRSDRKDPEKRRERFEAAALAALKQSGRNRMPELREPVELAAVELFPGERGFYGSTRGGLSPRRLERAGTPARVRLVVGPEGGLGEAEEEALRARGFEALSLGAGVLRVETAVIALVSWFAAAAADEIAGA